MFEFLSLVYEYQSVISHVDKLTYEYVQCCKEMRVYMRACARARAHAHARARVCVCVFVKVTVCYIWGIVRLMHMQLLPFNALFRK